MTINTPCPNSKDHKHHWVKSVFHAWCLYCPARKPGT